MITAKQAIKDIQQNLSVSEEEAKEIYETQADELNKILEAVKLIPELQQEIQKIKRSMRNLFAIMDSALPNKISSQDAYKTAKALVQDGTN